MKFKISESASVALDILHKNGYEAYIVGGSVRDMYLGQAAHDFDITTNAVPHITKNLFCDFTVIETGMKHGTVTAVISGENIDELARLADNIKAINPNAVIGITFTREIMAHPDSAFYVDKLKGAYDFTCLDLSNNGEDNAVEYVNTAVSENLLYILRDKMRILLPSVDSDTQELLKTALASNSVSNWQIVS